MALLALGMSLRQAAAVLGVSHNTIRNAVKSDAALAEEITAARFQAQLQPLACVIREARRSWKAATWLLKYLDGKIAAPRGNPRRGPRTQGARARRVLRLGRQAVGKPDQQPRKEEWVVSSRNGMKRYLRRVWFRSLTTRD